MADRKRTADDPVVDEEQIRGVGDEEDEDFEDTDDLDETDEEDSEEGTL